MIEVQVVIERTARNYGAFARYEGVNVVATGKTRKQVMERIESGLRSWFADRTDENVHIVYSEEATLALSH